MLARNSVHSANNSDCVRVNIKVLNHGSLD